MGGRQRPEWRVTQVGDGGGTRCRRVGRQRASLRSSGDSEVGGRAGSLVTSTHERAESEKPSDATNGHCGDSQHRSTQVPRHMRGMCAVPGRGCTDQWLIRQQNA
jgi:hypothetical protein